MRITDIREQTLAMSSAMRNASIGFGGMTASALTLVSDVVRNGKPMVGLAYDSVGRYGHGGLLRERFIPRLLAADPDEYRDDSGANLDPFKVWAIVMRDEKPGGHGERPGAVGLIDAAVWDLVAKLEDKPLWYVLAERFGGRLDDVRVPVYATGGHYREVDDLAHLREEVRRNVALGYKRIKIKIGGIPLAQDLRRIEAAIDVLGSGAALAVDCNGTLSKAAALELLSAVSKYGLAWVEEPVDPLDFELHKELALCCPLPLATGENIFSAADTLNLVRYAGLRPDRDLLQMDVSLSYGIVEYLRMLNIIESHGWSRRQCVPHAGHLLSFNVVAGLGLGGHETSPNSNLPLTQPLQDGFVRPGNAPGVGFEQSKGFAALFGKLLA
jgi:L-alanine-DL-glutamate epimerase-like enolase superfamily enzyme